MDDISANEMSINDIKIKGDFITLASLLKFCGEAATGGEAKQLVKSGDVKVNGEVSEQKGKKLRNGDIVEISGRRYRTCNNEDSGDIA